MFDRCIICRSTTNQLTEEHIVPEFVGGALKVPFVCKQCNDKMGGTFEGAASRNILISLPRYQHGIQGKAEKLVIPLPKTGVTREGVKISLNENFDPYVLTNVSGSLHPDGSYVISTTVDTTEKSKIPGLVEKKLLRYLAKEYPKLSKEEKAAYVAEVLSNIPDEPTVQSSQSPIHYAAVFDIRDLQFLFIKMAYEISIYHHGPSYLNDSIAEKIRGTIYDRIYKSKLDSCLAFIQNHVGDVYSLRTAFATLPGNRVLHSIPMLLNTGAKCGFCIRIGRTYFCKT